MIDGMLYSRPDLVAEHCGDTDRIAAEVMDDLVGDEVFVVYVPTPRYLGGCTGIAQRGVLGWLDVPNGVGLTLSVLRFLEGGEQCDGWALFAPSDVWQVMAPCARAFGLATIVLLLPSARPVTDDFAATQAAMFAAIRGVSGKPKGGGA